MPAKFRLPYIVPFGQLGTLQAQTGRMPFVAPERRLVHGVLMNLTEAANADVIIDVMHDAGSGFASVFADPADRPRIASGETGPEFFDLEADGLSFVVEQFEAVRIDLEQAGTTGSEGEDLTVQLLTALLPEL